MICPVAGRRRRPARRRLTCLVAGQGGGPYLARLKCQHGLGAYTQEGVRLGVDPYNERLIPVVWLLK